MACETLKTNLKKEQKRLNFPSLVLITDYTESTHYIFSLYYVLPYNLPVLAIFVSALSLVMLYSICRGEATGDLEIPCSYHKLQVHLGAAGAFDLPGTPAEEVNQGTSCKQVIGSVSFPPTMCVEQKTTFFF